MLAATILSVASGCDKLTPERIAVRSTPATDAPATDGSARPADTLDLGPRPHVLYQVFGERSDPRMMPIAALTEGRIRPLVLSHAGWQRFDSLYHRPGTVYTVFQDGRATGTARVTEPMWDTRGRAIYSLPHCRRPTPLAAVSVRVPPPVGYMVELLATDAPLETARPARRPRRGGNDHLDEARRVAGAVAQQAGLAPEALAELDFSATAVSTGTSETPTLVVSFVDPAAATGDGGTPRYLFVLADRVRGEYVATYERIVRGDGTSQYRRYVDRLDLTGDGVDELVLEGWSGGQESYMLVLQFQEGRWMEVFRGRTNWCLD